MTNPNQVIYTDSKGRKFVDSYENGSLVKRVIQSQGSDHYEEEEWTLFISIGWVKTVRRYDQDLRLLGTAAYRTDCFPDSPSHPIFAESTSQNDG